MGTQVPRDTILCGDALEVLRGLPDGIVQTCVTSPPYFGLRDYGVDGQIGLEESPDEWCARLVAVFREVRRVLRDDGTLWVNIGDSYANDLKWGGATGGKHARGLHGNTGVGRGKRHTGLKPKDLIGQPWMLAFALRADGWYLRSDIIWHKSNPMPESVTDRPTKAHEYLFLLSKSTQYYYDADAIREPVTGGAHPRARAGRNSREHVDRDPRHLAAVPSGWDTRVGSGGHGSIHREGRRKPGVTPKSAPAGRGIKANESFHAATTQLVNSRNKRDVWTVATAPFADAHFATFPPRLIEPCILAGTSPQACEHCGAPWARVTKRYRTLDGVPVESLPAMRNVNRAHPSSAQGTAHRRTGSVAEHRGWQPTCHCTDNTGAGRCIVLDPFMGAGTTAIVARRHSRHYLGIELNPSYIELAEERIAAEIQPVLWSAAGERSA